MPILNSSTSARLSRPQEYKFSKNSRNVMELLVVEEVDRQIQSLPLKIARYITPSEVVAYALNRLPPLYATSKRGWQRQLHRGRTEFYQKIATAVRQGIIAVQRDPLRANDALSFAEDNNNGSGIALQELRQLLQRDDLSWDNLSDIVEQALLNTLRGKVTWRRSSLAHNGEHANVDWERYRI
ncbi:late competence development ComFB family protein [Richelia sinica]|nr:late competence development ComFB family protein [Richelia sinica]